MHRDSRRLFAAVFIAITPALGLLAQSNTGSIYGTVVDEQGSPIPDAAVTLTGPAGALTTATDIGGLFRFLKVPPGPTTIVVSRPGFAAMARRDVVVSVGRSVQLDFALRLTNVEEDVTVSGQAVLVDSRNVTTGQTFSNEELTQIPTSRDVWALVQQVPGVQLDTVNVAGNASADIPGAALTSRGSGNVAYEVDGATITDNTWGNPFARQNGGTDFYFDFSTFQNVEIVTGGSALDQQSSGVTINVVTKRGTNQWKGSARYLYASANWQSNNTPQDSIDMGVQTNSTRFIREYGGDVGFPLLKDRLWLWASGGRQDISLNPGTIDAGQIPYPETATLEPWSAKLNAQISNSNSASLYYLRSDRLAYGTGVDVDRPPETRLNLIIPADFYKIEDSNVFSADLFGAIFASYMDPTYNQQPVGGLDKDMQYYDNSFHNSNMYYVGKEPIRQANLQVSKFFSTGRISHELKFSFNYRQQVADSASGLPGDQNFGVEYSPSSAVAYLTRGVRRIYRTEFWTGTLGDTLTAGNLTVAAGVRYDLQRARNLPSTSIANPLFAEPCTNCGADGGSFPGLPEVHYHGSNGWQFEFTNWQPRVSVTYAAGSGKSTLLRASYARYADQLGFLAGSLNGVPASNGYAFAWTDLNHDHNVQPDEVLFNQPLGYWSGIDPAVLPSVPNEVQPGLRTPATNEFTAGVDQQLGRNLAVSGTFSYRNTDRLLSQVQLGTDLSTYEFGGHATGVATASNGFSLPFDEPYYPLTLAEPPPGYLIENRPGATQKYYGVDLSIQKSFSDGWALRANFGWNSFRQYLARASIQNPNNLWDLGGQNDNGGLATGWTPKFNVFLNADWQFNLNGLYVGPWGLTFGANFFGRQGYPNPYRVRVQMHDAAGQLVALLIDRVDTYRYPNVYQLDLRLQRPLLIGLLTVTPAVELFNATNANTLLNSFPGVGIWDSADRSFTPNSYFNQAIEIQSPRILRLSLQIDF